VNNDYQSKLPVLYHQSAKDFYVIAHRGASACCPENTMTAFYMALEMKADMIELDVLITKDGIPVVFHDPVVDKKTDGTGEVNKFTLAEMKKLDAGSWFARKYAGERIPTLEEVLQWAKGRIAINIEIKREAVGQHIKGGVEEKVVHLVRKYQMEQHVLLSSFSYEAAWRIKKLAPEISTGLLYDKKAPVNSTPHALTRQYQCDSFNCKWRELKNRWRRELQEQGIPIFIYTVNSTFWIQKIIGAGVTGIFSDRPDRLREIATRELGKPD
jgi:glycerophosphoryl diester phosphodiesterase